MVARSQSKDYYYTLGVQEDASAADIKAAFRRLAKQYHPDLALDAAFAEEHFKQINEAYETLRDPQKRARYDFSRPNLNANLNGGHAASLLSRSRRARSVLAEDALREVDRFRRDIRSGFRYTGADATRSANTPEAANAAPLSQEEAQRVVKLAELQGYSAVAESQGAVVFLPERREVGGVRHTFYRPQRLRTVMDAIAFLLARNNAA